MPANDRHFVEHSTTSHQKLSWVSTTMKKSTYGVLVCSVMNCAQVGHPSKQRKMNWRRTIRYWQSICSSLSTFQSKLWTSSADCLPKTLSLEWRSLKWRSTHLWKNMKMSQAGWSLEKFGRAGTNLDVDLRIILIIHSRLWVSSCRVSNWTLFKRLQPTTLWLDSQCRRYTSGTVCINLYARHSQSKKSNLSRYLDPVSYFSSGTEKKQAKSMHWSCFRA